MDNTITRAPPAPQVKQNHDVEMEDTEYTTPPQCIWNREDLVINIRLRDQRIEVIDEGGKFHDF